MPDPKQVVQRGDTLFRLARRYGTTVQAIMAANKLCSTVIVVGQRLLIPVCPTPAPAVVVPMCPPAPAVVAVPACSPVACVPVCPPPPPVCVPVCPPVVCVPVCQCPPVRVVVVDP
jgi:hypothetical protein